MKVIDLLNKIANGEEVPKKIKFNHENWIYYGNQYINPLEGKEKYKSLLARYTYKIMDDEVEVIEEDKDIEKLKIEQDGSTYYIKNEHGTKCYLTKHSYLIGDKVNELINEVNKLKNK